MKREGGKRAEDGDVELATRNLLLPGEKILDGTSVVSLEDKEKTPTA